MRERRQQIDRMFQAIMQNHQLQQQDATRVSTYADFLGTRPPTFVKAKAPMEAYHWLQTIESKFELLQCDDNQQVQFAAHQLQGAAEA
ncbi:hypothetical protein ACP4OV_024236 [Aristida adscensionis]